MPEQHQVRGQSLSRRSQEASSGREHSGAEGGAGYEEPELPVGRCPSVKIRAGVRLRERLAVMGMTATGSDHLAEGSQSSVTGRD